MWLRVRTAHPRDTFRSALLCWENLGSPHQRDPRGSHFQMPARLADGLGHGSDLGHSYPWPLAPSSTPAEELGSPALTSRKEGQLRLHLLLTNPSHEQKRCQAIGGSKKRS